LLAVSRSQDCAIMISLTVAPHPLLEVRAFTTAFPAPLGQSPTPPDILALLRLDAPAPVHSDDSVRDAVRRMLRHGGFKPAGRSKPASEYLLKAVGDGTLSSINAAVDVCNIVSLHSGLPISVVDLDKAQPPFRVAIVPSGASYVFNASGQTIDLAGLVCLEDSAGPCGNAVKDAQRTKTDAATRRTLSVIWGSNELGDRTGQAEMWYRELLRQVGAATEDVARTSAT
jgi:DNA/RNA-binding domain of Phe-tRNA-synthetase-like protein